MHADHFRKEWLIYINDLKSSSPSPIPWRTWPICEGRKSRPCLLKLMNCLKKWIGLSLKPVPVNPSSRLAAGVVTNPSELMALASVIWRGGTPKYSLSIEQTQSYVSLLRKYSDPEKRSSCCRRALGYGVGLAMGGSEKRSRFSSEHIVKEERGENM